MVYFIYDIPSLKLTARTCKKGHGLNHLDEFVFVDFSRNPRHLVRGQRLFSKDKEHKTPHTHPNQPTETNTTPAPPPKRRKAEQKTPSNLTIRSHPHSSFLEDTPDPSPTGYVGKIIDQRSKHKGCRFVPYTFSYPWLPPPLKQWLTQFPWLKPLGKQWWLY